jgi:hypothetical protein
MRFSIEQFGFPPLPATMGLPYLWVGGLKETGLFLRLMAKNFKRKCRALIQKFVEAVIAPDFWVAVVNVAAAILGCTVSIMRF